PAPSLDVRPEYAAHAWKAVDVLALAPAVLGLGPLGGPLEIAQRGACLDRRAADAARDRRLDLAADGGDGRLVDLSESTLDLAHVDAGLALGAERERAQVTVAEPAGDIACALGRGEGLLVLTLEAELERADDVDPAVDDRVVDALEETVCAVQPGGSDRVGCPEEVLLTKQGRRGRRPDRVAGLDVG